MKPVTKDGRAIRLAIFDRMLAHAKLLSLHGYIESALKPNLFCCHYRSVSFYADMRGTREVQPWVDDRPLFYWYWHTPLPLEVRQRTVLVECVRLGRTPLRLATIQDVASIEESVLMRSALDDGALMLDSDAGDAGTRAGAGSDGRHADDTARDLPPKGQPRRQHSDTRGHIRG